MGQHMSINRKIKLKLSQTQNCLQKMMDYSAVKAMSLKHMHAWVSFQTSMRSTKKTKN